MKFLLGLYSSICNDVYLIFVEKEMEVFISSFESMDISESSFLGDGGEEGDIILEKFVVYVALEVCLCVIFR